MLMTTIVTLIPARGVNPGAVNEHDILDRIGVRWSRCTYQRENVGYFYANFCLSHLYSPV